MALTGSPALRSPLSCSTARDASSNQTDQKCSLPQPKLGTLLPKGVCAEGPAGKIVTANETANEMRTNTAAQSLSNETLLAINTSMQRLASDPSSAAHRARYYQLWSENSDNIHKLVEQPKLQAFEPHGEAMTLAQVILDSSVDAWRSNAAANVLLDTIFTLGNFSERNLKAFIEAFSLLSPAQRVVVFGFVRASLAPDAHLLNRLDALTENIDDQLNRGQVETTKRTATTGGNYALPTGRRLRSMQSGRVQSGLLGRLPETYSRLLNCWLVGKKRISQTPRSAKLSLGLNEGHANTCYIHTGIQMLRKSLDAPALTHQDAESLIERVIARASARAGVSPAQFCELLHLAPNDRLNALRALRGYTEHLEKVHVTKQIVTHIQSLQGIFGKQINKLTAEEKGLILNEIEQVASGQIISQDARAALYRLTDGKRLAAAIRQHLDNQPQYISNHERQALTIVQNYGTELRKLVYLDTVLTLKQGANLPNRERQQLLAYLAKNVETLGGASVGEQGDAGEFSAKITELYQDFFPEKNSAGNGNYHEIVQTQYHGTTAKMMRWAQKSQQQPSLNSVKPQDMANTVFLPMAAAVDQFNHPSEPITLQRVIDLRFATERHTSRDFAIRGPFQGAKHLALSKQFGFAALPARFSIRVDRKSMNFINGFLVEQRNNRQFDLNTLRNIPLHLPVFDANKNRFEITAAAYNVVGFSVHQGGSSGGHWFAYVKLNDGQWACINEGSVSIVNSDEALGAATSASSFNLERA
jgi:hypothetical protein